MRIYPRWRSCKLSVKSTEKIFFPELGIVLGTIEKSDEMEEEIYETINISKIKAQTPNLRVSLVQ